MRSDNEFGNEADFYGGSSDDEREEDRRESPHASNHPQNEAGPSKPRSARKPRSKNNSILSYVKVEKSFKQSQPLDCERWGRLSTEYLGASDDRAVVFSRQVGTNPGAQKGADFDYA